MKRTLDEIAAAADTQADRIQARIRHVIDVDEIPSRSDIRLGREWLGYSQADLARALGFKRHNTIRELETDARFAMTPTVSKLFRLLLAINWVEYWDLDIAVPDAWKMLQNFIPEDLR